MKKFRGKYRIPSARLSVWDYASPGSYFITICTKKKKNFFGEIVNGEMQLNDIGRIALKCWADIPLHFTNTELDEFVVMPNHVHGIIIINGTVFPINDPAISNNDPAVPIDDPAIPIDDPTIPIDDPTIPIDDPAIVETGHALSLQQQQQQQPQQQKRHPRFRNQGKNTISAMVGSFKSAVTKDSRSINPEFGWQSRFHDHIIRDQDAFKRIARYIRENPKNWETDRFYK